MRATYRTEDFDTDRKYGGLLWDDVKPEWEDEPVRFGTRNLRVDKWGEPVDLS